MKLKNVHYEYRGNDTWRIYFKDALEADDFRNERTDGQKAQIAMLLPIFTNGKGVRYCVEAKLTGQFNILRRYVKDPINNHFSSDPLRNLVKKIEGADSDYLFDDIDLWYDATFDKCYFKICCMNGTWTEFFVKNMLNSQFGMVAQANGYSDTDTAYQGGLCTRRSCCGIGFDPSVHKTDTEWIIFSVKDYCPNGRAYIIKVSSWTNTFIGTNKENEKEYSWSDFKQYMQKLSSTGEDIWDIEWEYDETCPFTGTEVVDKLHLYLKPLAYKRLFEEKEEKQLLKNITDVVRCMTKVLGCGTLYYYNLYFDDKSDLKNVNDKHIHGSMLTSVKGTYYIRVVSYNKELPKNISSTTLVWDQEENRYSVEGFTIKNEKTVWLSTGTLWSNNDYLGMVQPLTPPPLPYWAKLDDDGKIGFRQKDMDEVRKEIDEVTKRIYEKLEFKFDPDTVACEYCKRDADICKEMLSATETAQTYGNLAEPIVFVNHKAMTLTEFIKDGKDPNTTKEKETKTNKEEKNMGPKETSLKDLHRRLYWGYINAVKPTKILVQGTATIIWWSDGTKTVVKCQKGDKMDPEKGIAMCVMKKFMGTNETHSNYLDFAKPYIAEYDAKQKAMAAARKKAADKKRRAAKKEEKGNGET